MFKMNRHPVFLFVRSGEPIPAYLLYKTKIQSQVIGGDTEVERGGGWGLWNPNHFLGCTSCAWRVNLSRRVAKEPSCSLVMSHLSLQEAQHTSLLVRSLTELMLSHILLEKGPAAGGQCCEEARN